MNVEEFFKSKYNEDDWSVIFKNHLTTFATEYALHVVEELKKELFIKEKK